MRSFRWRLWPPPAAPPPPTGVGASPGDAQVTVSWTAVQGATSYNSYWSTTSGVTPQNGTRITGAVSPYVHSGLSNGTPYYYVVTAVNAGGESAASTQVGATPALPVALAIIATPNPVKPGGLVTFTVTEANASSAGTGTHNVYATIPLYVTVPQANAVGWICSGGSWPCQPGQTLSASASTGIRQTTTLEFSGTVASESPPSDGTTLTATVSTSVSGYGTATTTVAVESAAGLELVMDEPSSLVTSDSTQTYRLTYSNTSSSGIAADLRMRLPSGMSFVSATHGGTVTDGVVQWSLGAVAPGSWSQVELTVQVATAHATRLFALEASLLSPSSQLTLARAATTSYVATGDTRQLSITAAPGPVKPGDLVTFTVTEANLGSSDVVPHRVYVTVPPFTSVASANAPSASCPGGPWPCQPGQPLFWTVNTGPGQTTTLHFSAMVASVNPPPNGSLLSTSVLLWSTPGANTAATSVAVEP